MCCLVFAATVPLFMCIPGSVVGGILCERLGPRRLQLLLSPLLTVSLAAMHLASWPLIQEAGSAQVTLLVTRVIQVGHLGRSSILGAIHVVSHLTFKTNQVSQAVIRMTQVTPVVGMVRRVKHL